MQPSSNEKMLMQSLPYAYPPEVLPQRTPLPQRIFSS